MLLYCLVKLINMAFIQYIGLGLNILEKMKTKTFV